jgi:hypothetical protein
MGKQITLFCEETPGLKLGPGTTSSFSHQRENTGDWVDHQAGDVIVFQDGYATFEESHFPEWADWIKTPGTPVIRIVDEGAGEATSAQGAVDCPVCGRSFKGDFALNGHLRSHAPKGVTTTNPASA